MFYAQPQLPKKAVIDEPDSADDLENFTTEDVIQFQKLPESHVKVHSNFQSDSKTPAQGGLALKDTTNSPYGVNMVNDHLRGKGHLRSQQDEALRKLIYSKSPKEAANEYLNNSRHFSSNSQSQVKTSKKQPSQASPTRQKQFSSYGSNAYNNNKENSQYEDNRPSASRYDEPVEVSAYTELANKLYTQKFYGNSQARKTNVANAHDSNLLLTPNEIQKLEEKRYFASKGSQEDTSKRLINQGELMEERSRIRSNTYISKELEECTFQPRINSNKPRRNLDEFLEDQKMHQMQAEEKKRKLQHQALIEKSKELNTPHKPEICQNSVKILEKRKSDNRTPVYQRLYSVGKNSQAKHMQGIADREDLFSGRESVESSQFIGHLDTRGDVVSASQYRKGYRPEETPTFTPNIHRKSKNLRRGDRIDNLLYNDALRRQSKAAETKNKKTKTTSTPGMSIASKRALATRFIKEFDIGILEFLEVEKEPKLNYLQLNEFLKKLCFLKESEYIENPHFTPERILLYDMWYILHADVYKGVHRRNLLVFLLAVLDLHFPITKIQKHEDENEGSQYGQTFSPNHLYDQHGNPLLPEEEGQPPYERRILGSFDDDGNYELNEDEVRKVHKVFDLYFINRMCSADNIGQLINTRSYQEPTYQPTINEASRHLAQNYREKMLEGTADLIQQNKIPAPKDGKITHADLLIVSKKVNKEKVERFSELLNEEETRECTFTPHINPYHGSSVSASNIKSPNAGTNFDTGSTMEKGTPSGTPSGNRAFELYALAKPRILKQDKSANEADYEKSYEECTFQPNMFVKREAKKNLNDPAEFYVKGIDKAVERMRMARAEKEQKQAQMQRGYSNGQEKSFRFSIDKRKFGQEPIVDSRMYYNNRSNNAQNAPMEYQEGYEYGIEQQNGYDQAQIGDSNEGSYDYRGYTQHQQQHPHPHQQEQRNYNYEQEQQEHQQEEYQQYEENNQYEEPEVYQQEQVGESAKKSAKHEDDNQPEEENETVPLLFVDVNLGQGRAERIVVYEGDRSDDLAQRFAEEHGLDPSMKGRLKDLLDSQIAGLLSRIDEEVNSSHSETERRGYGGQYGQFDRIQEEDD